MKEPTVLEVPRGSKIGESERSALIEVLRDEKIVAIPADTIYGIHGLARSTRAIERMDRAKGRPDSKPYLVLAADIDQVESLVSATRPTIEALSRLWPAPLTAILPIAGPVAAAKGAQSIAVRVPDDEWLCQLLRETGPLASSSLNRSGEPSTTRLPGREILTRSGVALAVDDGERNGQASTIVDFTQSLPRVVREGAFSFSQNLWKTVWKTL